MLTRYLVSQHFGKVAAQVTMNGSAGIVHLELELPRKRVLECVFDRSRMYEIVRPDEKAAELAIRLAVAQARKLGLHAPRREIPDLIDLKLDIAPWRGDLTLEPFGGATTGIEKLAVIKSLRRQYSMQERRRDKQMCKEVDRGVKLQSKHGAQAALDFLTQKRIPDHVVLRVVSCAAFRRK